MEISNKGNFYAGLAIMFGLIVLGAMLPTAVVKFKAAERTVSVKGLCEREVPADKVIWPIKYKVVGNDLASVYSETETKNATIREFLIKGGVSAEEITVAVPSVSDKFAQEYGNNDRTYRYVATSIVTLCSKDVDKALKLISAQNELIRKGIAPELDWETKIQFSFEGLNDIKPEMIQEATRNARDVAGRFASDSHSRLGKIKSASQGTFSIENRDSNTPQIKKVRIVTGIVYYLDN